MVTAQKRLDLELALLNRICDPESSSIIMEQVNFQYITAHKDRLSVDFEILLKDEQFEDCTRAHVLLSRIDNGLNPLLDTFEKYVYSQGSSYAKDFFSSNSQDPSDYVDGLSKLYTKFTEIKTRVFLNEPAYAACIDKVFT